VRAKEKEIQTHVNHFTTTERGREKGRKVGMTWFMPALAKRRVGSSWGTVADEGTKVCALDSK